MGIVSEEPQAGGKVDLRALLQKGALYADRWPPSVRAALDVHDPLVEIIATALTARRSVVISGNAGDGKSHLAQRALDSMPTRNVVEVSSSHPAPETLPPGAVIFLRDASSIDDAGAIRTVNIAAAARAPVLVTINEGPLASLASHSEGAFFAQTRDVLHSRALGADTPDPADSLVVSLSGRQLPRSEFVGGALEHLLPLVTPCTSCTRRSSCPRAEGAKMLRRSKRARDRLELVLRLLSDRGRHVSAREIWAFLTDLFFGWTCPPGADDADRIGGYFWMRIFEGDSGLSEFIVSEFDPVDAALAREDVALWQGRFEEVQLDVPYPGAKPVLLARTDEELGLRAFASAKRCLFFFGKGIEPERLLASRSLAPQFGTLLSEALSDSRAVIRALVGLINRYRLNIESENELWISRHHGFAAQRRPTALAAAGKNPIEQLELRVPFVHDIKRYGKHGFFPTRLLLHWKWSKQMLTIDFETWRRLKAERSLTIDREQETLDFALDLFMSQARIPPVADPEITVFDHRRNEESVIRIRPEERKIELLR